MLFFYKLFILLYYFFIRIASLWNEKAKAWVKGRKEVFTSLQLLVGTSDQVIWMHCASAGELEQGKPILEDLKKLYPTHKYLITFFSPSGFLAGKKYSGADIISYLPLDTRENASRFVNIIKPQLVIFVKYDFWYYHLEAIHQHKIPLLLIASLFRKNQIFFRSYGALHRKMLGFFTQIFVQDEGSLALLHSIQIQNCSVSGDTRFDRVTSIKESFKEVPYIEKFIANQPVLVAGSTWPKDESFLSHVSLINERNLKLIIAPHEVNMGHINKLLDLFPTAITYSSLSEEADKTSDVLIIDNTGMLSRLYHYATITYIGGGFNKSGIHNTLEAAVWGKPVIFGPGYHKFKEAKELLNNKAAFSFSTVDELNGVINNLMKDKETMRKASFEAKQYVYINRGATDMIIKYIQENRLLTTA